jgi:hypothetical protein
LCGRPICKITRFSSRPAIAQTTGARRPAPIIWRRFGPECLRRLRLSESSGVDRFLRAISKADPSVFESFPGVEQAVGGVLTDQNGRFVRYEVRINQDEYNYLIKNELWSKDGQAKFTPPVSFPDGPSEYGSIGAVEFKAAWKVLGENDEPNRFL